MLEMWLTPLCEWFGLPLVPLLLVLIIIILIVKD